MPENAKRHRGFQEDGHQDPTRKSYRPEASTIFLAVSERHIRRMLAGALREEGYEVIEGSGDGPLPRGLFHVDDTNAVDLIVVDLRNASWLSDLREADWSIPIVLVTAFAPQHLRTEAAELGADIVLDQPFGVNELVEAVRDLVPPTWD